MGERAYGPGSGSTALHRKRVTALGVVDRVVLLALEGLRYPDGTSALYDLETFEPRFTKSAGRPSRE